MEDGTQQATQTLGGIPLVYQFQHLADADGRFIREPAQRSSPDLTYWYLREEPTLIPIMEREAALYTCIMT